MLTVVVKNVKRNHILHPLAWNLASRLCGPKGSFNYVGTTLWCQDDVGIKPFVVGIHWVSNILHTYCLHFQKGTDPKNRARTEQVRTWENKAMKRELDTRPSLPPSYKPKILPFNLDSLGGKVKFSHCFLVFSCSAFVARITVGIGPVIF